jgi:hypothetical protein
MVKDRAGRRLESDVRAPAPRRRQVAHARAQKDLVSEKSSSWFGSAKDKAEDATRKAEREGSALFGGARDKADEVKRDAERAGNKLFGAARETADEAERKASGLFGAAKNTAAEAKDQAGAAARDAERKSSSWFSSNKVRPAAVLFFVLS